MTSKMVVFYLPGYPMVDDQIQESGDGRYSWLNTHPSYSCVVASPKKEAKFKGLKSYIAYQLTPSVSICAHCSSAV